MDEQKPIVPFKCVFETFRQFGAWEREHLEEKEPSCFNRKVSIRKYRITVEEIVEPKQVLRNRLHKLWRECDNQHSWKPLQNEAKLIGTILSHDERKK